MQWFTWSTKNLVAVLTVYPGSSQDWQRREGFKRNNVSTPCVVPTIDRDNDHMIQTYSTIYV